MSAAWETVEIPTHPLKGSRWVRIIARIRNNATGEVREYNGSNAILDDGQAEPSEWIWSGGNYSCDCNRRLFFGYAAGEKPGDIDDDNCGDGKFSVQVLNPVDGRAYYYEFPEGLQCTVNGGGDLAMNAEARPFIGAACVVVKMTKAGLAQVALADNPKRTISVPIRNIDGI
jgi:hypothetical protein